MRALLAAGFTCAMAASAAGAPFDQWVDPDLEQALKLAKVIAVGTVSRHETQVREMDKYKVEEAYTVLTVERTVLGTTPADGTLRFRRRGRNAAANPKPPAGTKVLVVLYERDGALSEFTATWGVFRFDDGRPMMPVRDPFARTHLDPAQLGTLARFLRAATPEPAKVRTWVESLLAAAAKTKAATKTLADVEAQVWAAEACHYFGRPPDAPRLIPFLESPYHQVRWSAARGLAGCGGDDAAAALVTALEREKESVVQAALARALHRLRPPAAAPVMEKLLATASKEHHTLRRNLMDPRLNDMPSAHAALTAALKAVQGEAGDFYALSGWRGNPWRRDVARAAKRAEAESGGGGAEDEGDGEGQGQGDEGQGDGDKK